MPTLQQDHQASSRPRMPGTGTYGSVAGANLRATAEALERFCSTVFDDSDVLWASAEELGNEAVDTDLFPRCSEREYANEKCPLRPLGKRDRIRWSRAFSLMTGEEKFLPLRSVFIAPPARPAERFMHAISTGCAAHTDPVQALLSAALEVVERDALALTWLQQFTLPRIDPLDEFIETNEIGRMLNHAMCGVTYALFDATTDLGIPVVYGIRLSELDDRLRTLVACSASTEAEHACEKTILELTSFATWLRPERGIPCNPADFHLLHHGPVYMASKDNAKIFDFLLESKSRTTLQEMREVCPFSSGDKAAEKLKTVLRLLSLRNYEAFAVDLTTREARQCGMRVVRVVIPGLMPFSWVQRARFLGHPRLHEAQERMGYPLRQEDQLNPYPQPFG